MPCLHNKVIRTDSGQWKCAYPECCELFVLASDKDNAVKACAAQYQRDLSEAYSRIVDLSAQLESAKALQNLDLQLMEKTARILDKQYGESLDEAAQRVVDSMRKRGKLNE